MNCRAHGLVMTPQGTHRCLCCLPLGATHQLSIRDRPSFHRGSTLIERMIIRTGHFEPQLYGSSHEAHEVVRTKLADGKFDLDAFRTTQSEQRASEPLRFAVRESS